MPDERDPGREQQQLDARGERDAHNHAVQGTALDVGLIRRGNDLTHTDGTPEQKQKKERTSRLLLQLQLQNIARELDDTYLMIDQKLDELEQSLNRTSRIKRAMEAGDLTELAIILQETGVETTGKSFDELAVCARDELHVEQLKQETLIQEIRDLAEDYKATCSALGQDHPELETQYMQKLGALEDKAQCMPGLDFKAAFGSCFKADADNGFYDLGYNQATLGEEQRMLSTNFNAVASPDATESAPEVVLDNSFSLDDPDLAGGPALSF